MLARMLVSRAHSLTYADADSDPVLRKARVALRSMEVRLDLLGEKLEGLG